MGVPATSLAAALDHRRRDSEAKSERALPAKGPARTAPPPRETERAGLIQPWCCRFFIQDVQVVQMLWGPDVEATGGCWELSAQARCGFFLSADAWGILVSDKSCRAACYSTAPGHCRRKCGFSWCSCSSRKWGILFTPKGVRETWFLQYVRANNSGLVVLYDQIRQRFVLCETICKVSDSSFPW
jgi:hypothetical protein